MKKSNNKLIVFVGSLILIGIILFVGYRVLQNMPSNTKSTGTGQINVTIIGDKRCNSCITKEITDKIQEAPFLSGAVFIVQDFSESGVESYLKDNEIKFLPAFIFSTKDIVDDSGIGNFLAPLKNGSFILEVGSKFDPFSKRSGKGFLILAKDKIESLKKGSYVEGDTNAKITWIEYADLQCEFCAKLHNSGVIEALSKRYGSNLNRVFQHFPITQAHVNALPAAQLLECAGEIGGGVKFYELSSKIYTAKKSDKKFILEEAVKIGLDVGKLELCLDDEKFKEKILNQQKMGSEVFGVSSTPTNILINNETGEYEELNGALPKEKFEEVIEKLLK